MSYKVGSDVAEYALVLALVAVVAVVALLFLGSALSATLSGSPAASQMPASGA